MTEKHANDRFLVTGAMGCLGAWTVRLLIDAGADVTALDLSENRSRLRLLASDQELDSVRFVQGDITDGETVQAVVSEHAISKVVHLAALQVPFCQADPVLGARVNIVGTLNVFEAAKKASSRIGISYASSIAVFGPPSLYSEGRVTDDALQAPTTFYGAYKQACEHAAKVYAATEGLGSIGLRPLIVYGPGRDQGLTSGTTKAILAAAAGRAFHIDHGGRSTFQFAPDVARVFIRAARQAANQAEVYNVGGTNATVTEVVDAIRAVATEAIGQITHGSAQLPLPEDVDDTGLQKRLGPITYTPLEAGVAKTIAIFRQRLAEGRLTPPLDA